MRLADLFAVASEMITASSVEASEYPELVQKYGIQGVPKTVINEDIEFVGAQPEQRVLQYVQQASAAGAPG